MVKEKYEIQMFGIVRIICVDEHGFMRDVVKTGVPLDEDLVVVEIYHDIRFGWRYVVGEGSYPFDVYDVGEREIYEVNHPRRYSMSQNTKLESRIFMILAVAGMAVAGMLWAAKDEPEKVFEPPILPAEISRLSEICTKNGAYSSYLIIEKSQPRKVMCKFERRVKSTDSLGGQHWSREVYTYDAKQLEKEKKV